ncbi:MAG: sterol desaturase family protein, partial [Bacteroidota bacterium]
KVHHSVEEMGFAAHLRYHWMENVVYKGLQAIPLSMLGFNLVDLFYLHFFNLTWGHFNHSNITVNPRITGTIFGGLIGLALNLTYATTTLGTISYLAGGLLIGFVIFGQFMHYIFNSPEMHLWHHAHDLPEDRTTGVNFGLTLACWDWIFGTVYWPHNRGDVKLGFPGLDRFPKGFVGQVLHGFGREKTKKEA